MSLLTDSATNRWTSARVRRLRATSCGCPLILPLQHKPPFLKQVCWSNAYVEAWMDARIFARFHLDVGIADVVMQPLEAIRCRDWLEFAGVRSPLIRMIACEQQFAEKLHAYTLPRIAPNSRVKDLIDLVLLIRLGNLREDRVMDAIRLTFEKRRTHPVPSEISPPPLEWEKQFRSLAEECRLSADMNEAFTEVRSFVARLSGKESRR